MEGIERKSFPFQLEDKGLNEEKRTFKGYFAVFGNWDGRGIIDYGACKKTLKEMGDRVRIFWIHDLMNPIGRPLELKEVPRSRLPAKLLERAPDATGGLYVHGEIDPIPEGDRALIQMKTGTLGDGSIGFKTIKDYYETDEDGISRRHIAELMLLDVSPVPIGMNVGAIITEVKEFKIEESDDFIHVPVPGEAGKHEGPGHRIRYIDISPEKGIRAKFCGVHKVNISYVFAKAKGWTRVRAIAWVKEHPAKKGETPDEILQQAIFEMAAEVEDLIISSVDGYLTKGVFTLTDLEEVAVKANEVITRLKALEEGPVPDEEVKALLLSAEIQEAELQEAMLVNVQGQAEPS